MTYPGVFLLRRKKVDERYTIHPHISRDGKQMSNKHRDVVLFSFFYHLLLLLLKRIKIISK